MDDRTSLLEKLLCFRCQNYLSYFPIYSDVNQNSICGRCQPSDVQNFYHNEIYEKSMEAFAFPCSYCKNGCKKTHLHPKDVPTHEDGCEFRTIQCPALNSLTDAVCDWKGFSSDIYEHFEQEHPQFILRDGKFEADFITNRKGVFLYAFAEHYFIVTKTINSIKSIATVNVEYIGNKSDVKNYNFKITYTNADGAKDIDVVEKIGQTVEIDGKTVLDLLGYPFSILAEFTVYEDINNSNGDIIREIRNPAVNYEMIEGMKCTVSVIIHYIRNLLN